MEFKDGGAPRLTEADAIALLRTRMAGENGGTLPSTAQIAAEVAAAAATVEALSKKAEAVKSAVKALKSQIDKAKLHFHSLDADAQAAGLLQLQGEIGWRAEEINRRTPEIARMLADLATARGALEQAELKARCL